MSSPWMLSLVLFAAPPTEPLAVVGALSASDPTMSVAGFREAYRDSAQVSGRVDRRTLDAWMAQYRALPHVDGLKPGERRRMERSLRTRLLRASERLLAESDMAQNPGGGPQNRINDLIELIQTTVAPDSWVPGGPAIFALGGGGAGGNVGGGFVGGAGGNVNANAVSLIELIQGTVQPETWQINGGNGVIMQGP